MVYIKSNSVSIILKSSMISLSVASLLFVGCGTKNNKLPLNDFNKTVENNATTVKNHTETQEHTSSFQIQKSSSAEAIFGQLSKIDKTTYIVKNDGEFKALYISNQITNFNDVKEFVELHDYSLVAKKHNRYTLIELVKNDTKIIEKLLKTQVSIKGAIPLSVAISEISSQIGIGYSFDKNLAVQMSQINHFYYEGDAKGAFEHIAQKSGVEVSFLEDKVVLEKYATAFVAIDLPLKNRSLATNIINNISGATSTNGTTTSTAATTEGATASSDGIDVTIQASDKQSIVEAYNQFIPNYAIAKQ